MSKIRIALCITELDFGGAERCLTELALRMDRQRFEPVVYCLGPRPVCDEASCVPMLERGGIEVHCLGGQSVWQFAQVARQLRRLLVVQRPHILQTFLFHGNVLGRLAARRAGVPAIAAGVRVAEHAARWHLWADRLTQRFVDRYVCVSQAVAEFTAKSGIPREKLTVIPNGIDLDKYPASQPADLQRFGIQAGRQTVVFIGRLESQKGVAWLVASARTWLTDLPNSDLLLVGDGPLRMELETSAQKAGIGDRVHFAGWRCDVPQILAACDLLVLPSAWEGMPNVVLEAMASGRAVVAADVEGVRELLGPLASQQTVPYGNTPAIVGKIADILLDADAIQGLGESNRRRAEQNFSISQTVASYEALWESLARP